jgi:DNA-binding MarR family transcriptional regulator
MTGGRIPSSRRRSAAINEVDAWALTDLVTRLRRVLRASIRRDYAWEVLPMAQVEMLQRLDEEPGLRISELAERHRLAPNTVSNLVQAMVVTGLVTRTPATDDRRAVVLHLTASGKANLQGWRRAHEQRIEHALNALDARDTRAILAAMPALSRLVTQLDIDEHASPDQPD